MTYRVRIDVLEQNIGRDANSVIVRGLSKRDQELVPLADANVDGLWAHVSFTGKKEIMNGR